MMELKNMKKFQKNGFILLKKKYFNLMKIISFEDDEKLFQIDDNAFELVDFP